MFYYLSKSLKRRRKMAHRYWLCISIQDDLTIESVESYLLDEEKVITNLKRVTQTLTPPTVTIEVEAPNRSKFEAYLRRREKNRSPNDFREHIKSYEYLGPTGKTAGSSKLGRQSAARKRNVKRGQKN
jgi:hypothetical protein